LVQSIIEDEVRSRREEGDVVGLERALALSAAWQANRCSSPGDRYALRMLLAEEVVLRATAVREALEDGRPLEQGDLDRLEAAARRLPAAVRPGR
jgi:hypothetical protein